MAHKLQNFYKLFRSGYLSSNSMSAKMKEEADWLLNQINDEVKTKLLELSPELYTNYSEKVLQAEGFREYGHYRSCQRALRDCHNLLFEIQTTLRIIDWYLDISKTYKVIEKKILIHESLHLSTIKLYQNYLQKAKEEIKANKLEKAKLLLSVCSEEISNALKTSKKSQQRITQLNTKIEEINYIVQQTVEQERLVSNSLEANLIVHITSVIAKFIEDRKYTLSDMLLDDLYIQLGARRSFLLEWERAKRILREDFQETTKDLNQRLSQSGWDKARFYLMQCTAAHLNNNINNIQTL